MATKRSKTSDFDVTSHELVPKHELCNDKERKEIFDKYHAIGADFPRIFINDPAIRHLGVQEGDLIKITRSSPTAGGTVFYRIVMLE